LLPLSEVVSLLLISHQVARAHFNCNAFSYRTINLMSHSDDNPANKYSEKGSALDEVRDNIDQDRY
jgi:hypothetical protein